MTPNDLMTILAGIAGIILVVSLCTVLYRVTTTHNDARRAVLGDMLFMAMAALFLCYSLTHRTSIAFEVAIFAGLFGPLSTYAYARIITRGRR